MTLELNDPRLTAYALGELDPREAALLEVELAESPEGERALVEIRATAEQLRQALAAELAAPVINHQAIDQQAVDQQPAAANVALTLSPDARASILAAATAQESVSARPVAPTARLTGWRRASAFCRRNSAKLSVCGLLIAAGVGLIVPAVRQARDAARQVAMQNNLKQSSIALSNYHDSLQNAPATDSSVNKPSPYWLTDDVDYFAPGPEFKLTNEAVKLKTQGPPRSSATAPISSPGAAVEVNGPPAVNDPTHQLGFQVAEPEWYKGTDHWEWKQSAPTPPTPATTAPAETASTPAPNGTGGRGSTKWVEYLGLVNGQEVQTGKLTLGAGVNSNAGLNGSVQLEQRKTGPADKLAEQGQGGGQEQGIVDSLYSKEGQQVPADGASSIVPPSAQVPLAGAYGTTRDGKVARADKGKTESLKMMATPRVIIEEEEEIDLTQKLNEVDKEFSREDAGKLDEKRLSYEASTRGLSETQLLRQKLKTLEELRAKIPAPAAQMHLVQTTDGRVITGQLVGDADDTITLRVGDGNEIAIPRKQIDELTLKDAPAGPLVQQNGGKEQNGQNRGGDQAGQQGDVQNQGGQQAGEGRSPAQTQLALKLAIRAEALKKKIAELEQVEGANTEAYSQIVENPFTAVAQQPLSTFSIDVDTASYANVRRFLTQNALPPAGAVRIEEMINYFRYDYAGPKDGTPFAAATAVAVCPWAPAHRLVRIGLKGREIAVEDRPASNLVFLIDVSGSMQDANKLPLVKEGLRMLVEKLGENDRVAMVVYAGASGLVLPSTLGSDREKIMSAIDALQSGGSTNGGAGIELAYQTAVTNFIRGGANRVILATDGDFNVGVTSEADLVSLIEKKAASGVFLSVLGFGMGNYKDANLEKLADKGNGNYAYIDSVAEARKVLVEELSGTLVTIAKDVKIQIEFNPAKVQAYRLIGYENRMLAKEDFNDDKKDAGEIGAGHTVTALYEVVPAGAGVPVPAVGTVDKLEYQSDAQPNDVAAKSNDLLMLKLRYKEPDGDVSKLLKFPVADGEQKIAAAGDDFEFASAVAAFGMMLRGSAHKGTANYAMVLELAEAGRGADREGYRHEFIDLVKRARQISGQ